MTAPADRETAGFTLIELLVMIGMLSLLAVTYIPAYAANRSGAKAFQCLNNHRQLVTAWTTQATDNSDRLLLWKPVAGNMSWSANPDNVNQELLVTYQDEAGSMVSSWAKYLTTPETWKCPADIVPAPNGPRVRSVSINGPVAGAPVTVPPAGLHYPVGRQYLNLVTSISQLRKPAEVMVSTDEHPDSINDSYLLFDPGKTPDLYGWRDLPASYHNGAVGISAADGRSEMHRWLHSTTLQPVTRTPKPWGSALPAPNSADVEWMNNMMPYRLR